MYRGNIWRFFVVHGLNHFFLWLPIWVVFFQQKGLSLTQIGLFDGVVWLLMAALEVPTGGVADRWGRKASIAIGTFLNSLAMFLVLTEVLSPLFLIGYALWGTAYTFVSGADMAFLYDSLKADGRATDAARLAGRYMAVLQGSQGVAALLGAAVATVDITLCFILTGLCGLAATAVALTFKEPPRLEEGDERLGYWRNLRAAAAITARRPVVRWLLLLGAMLPIAPFVINFVLLQPYALGVGLPLASLGVVVLAIRTAGVAGSSLAHRTAGHVELPTLVALGIGVTLAATTLLAAVPSAAAVGLILAVALAPSVVRPLLSARLNDLIPSAQRATILSLASLVFTLAIAVAEPVLLAFADAFGAPFAIGVSTAIYAATVIPLAVLWRSAERRAPLAPEPIVIAEVAEAMPR